MAKVESASQVSRKERIHQVIFEADTPSGKFFDIALLLAILASILTVSLESVDSIDQAYHTELRLFEWAITILFT
jgi:voltage-gated potassium channel